MTPERLAEIRADDERAIANHPGGHLALAPFTAEGQRHLLLEYVDELGTGVTIFRGERDGAFASMRAFGDALRRISDTWLVGDPGNPGWNLVSSAARQLLAAGGTDWRLHFATGSDGPGCGVEPPAGFPLHATFDEDEPSISCAACRAYIAGLKAGRNQG